MLSYTLWLWHTGRSKAAKRQRGGQSPSCFLTEAIRHGTIRYYLYLVYFTKVYEV